MTKGARMLRSHQLAAAHGALLTALAVSSPAGAAGLLTSVSISYNATTAQSTETRTFSDGSTASTSSPGASVDVSDAIAAGANVQLSGVDATVTLTVPATTYGGVVSGTGTLTVGQAVNPSAATGTGATRVTMTTDGGTNPVGNGATLTLTQEPTLTVPTARQTESTSGAAVVTILGSLNPPVLVIRPGVTLVYGGSASTGAQVSFAALDPSGQVNLDNVLNDGVLQIVSGGGAGPRLGAISGTGSVSGDSFLITGTSTLSGVFNNGIQCFYGSAHIGYAMPNAKAIINDGSLLVSAAPSQPNVISQTIYESHFGDDINTDTGINIFSGVYSYSNNTSRQRPNLVDPGLVDPRSEGTVVTGTIGVTGNPAELNSMTLSYSGSSFTSLTHADANGPQDAALDAGGNSSFRGINIEGGTTQWGDGKTDVFFLPATPDNSYINLHNQATLAFDYDGSSGPVTLNVPVGGGAINASLTTAGAGDVEIMNPTGGHDVVVFSQPMFYNGTTTIAAGATLQLGVGHPQVTYSQTIELERDNSINYDPAKVISAYSGDSSLLVAQSAKGAPADAVVDNGVLVVDNTENAISLSNVSGSGSIVQDSIPNPAAVAGVPDTFGAQVAVLGLLPGTTKPGIPAVTLTGVNTYAGGTTIGPGATLVVDTATALGSRGAVGQSGPVRNRGTLLATPSNHVIVVPGDYDQSGS
jgi:hypothetical protein